jgi:membrane-bound lytic murein transglycosylase D
VDTGKVSIFTPMADDPYAASLDKLLQASYFRPSTMDSISMMAEAFETDPKARISFPDSVYIYRLRKLDATTPFDITFNAEVRAYIEVYAQKRRQQISRMMGLSELYFPLFEEMLDRYDLPLELKYLAIVESALNPTAKSRVGARGLWQFMYNTGKIYGLQVNSYVDQRCDPYLATEAACKYLAQLYAIFGDWNLALAAYNSGPGNVMKAIRRAGGKKDYWEIWPYLPKETRGYVPAFFAVNYIMKYAPEHKIYPQRPMISYVQVDTARVRDPLSFELLSQALDIPPALLEHLNPSYRLGVIPAAEPGKSNILCLPTDKMGIFMANQDTLLAVSRKAVATAPAVVVPAEPTTVTHKVKSGDNLGSIARKYGVSVQQIKRWNKLKSTNIQPGQKLTIHTSSSTVAQESEAPQRSKNATYKVKSGDTFYSIARKHGVSPDDLMKHNNIKSASGLKAGMTLRIPSP